MANTNAPSFVSSLAQPYIDYIQGQVEGLTFLPSAARSDISSLISGSSGASEASGSSGAAASSGDSGGSGAGASAGVASAAVGAAYAQPTIDYIREQINSVLPASIAGSITAGFPNASSSSGGSTEPSSVPVGVQNFLVPNAELRTFLSTLGNQSS